MNKKILFQHREEDKKLFLKLINKSEESFEDDINIIEKWLKTQLHLPEHPNRSYIGNFLKQNKCSIELTKKQIDMYYTLRTHIPDVFQNTHPKLEHMQQIAKVLYIVTLPKLTQDGNCITIVKLNSFNPDDLISYYYCLAHSLNVAEVRLAEESSVQDIIIFDCKGFGIAHIMRFTPVYLRQLSLIFTKMYTSRIYQLHFVNSPVGETLLKILKTFLSDKLSKRIIFHDNFKQMENYLPKEILPKDYGGNELSMQELNDAWMEKLVEYYPRFEELSKMRVNETLRPTPLVNDEVLGYYGNFKKLEVD